jgi:hypothetical protein
MGGDTPKRHPVRWMLTGGRFRMGELLELAATDPDKGAAHLEKIFGWYHDLATSIVKGTFRTAAAVVLALIAAVFKDEATTLVVSLAVAGVVVLVAGGLYQSVHLSHLHREYVLSVRLLDELQKFREELATQFGATGKRA